MTTLAEIAFRGSPPFLGFLLLCLRERLLFPIASLVSLTISLASLVVLSTKYSGTSRKGAGGAILLKTLSCFNRSAQTHYEYFKTSEPEPIRFVTL